MDQCQIAQGHVPYLLIWDVIQQCVYKPKIHDTDDLLKHWMQTCLDFEQDVINATIDVHPSEIMFPCW